MKSLVFKIGRRLPVVLIMAVIWFLSSQSTLPRIKGILGWDKLQHLGAYLVVAAALGLWFSWEWWQSRRVLCFFVTTGIASAYGIVDEVHQYFVPGRDCNIWDWMADTLGALLGALLIMVGLRIIYNNRRNCGAVNRQ